MTPEPQNTPHLHGDTWGVSASPQQATTVTEGSGLAGCRAAFSNYGSTFLKSDHAVIEHMEHKMIF